MKFLRRVTRLLKILWALSDDEPKIRINGVRMAFLKGGEFRIYIKDSLIVDYQQGFMCCSEEEIRIQQRLFREMKTQERNNDSGTTGSVQSPKDRGSSSMYSQLR